MNKPDKWIVVKIGGNDPIYKLFATWLGGYLGGDSWRMNSGITKVEVEGNFLNFYGYSGSCYTCHKDAYGTCNYTQGVIDNIFKEAKKQNISIETMPSDTDWMNFL